MTGYKHERYAIRESDLSNIFKTLWLAVFNWHSLLKSSFTVHHLVNVIKQGDGPIITVPLWRPQYFYKSHSRASRNSENASAAFSRTGNKRSQQARP
ncbi:hypothetical protein JAO73_06795 [Hymenobacter sp. BT523]|nr:hypothetical protein [Hymenobacter sp. BT523]